MKNYSSKLILILFFLSLTQIISIDPPKFSHDNGFYSTSELNELTLSSDNGLTIYYTLDSSDPTTSETAQVYSKPIPMYDRSKDENVYSKCQHEENSPYSITLKQGFRAGSFLFDKVTIIRAASQSEQGEFSPILTKTFFVMENDKLEFYKGLPAISLVTNPENLFDKDIGIYVCGQQYLDWKNSGDYNGGKNEYDTDNKANFFGKGKEWEREATIAYFKQGGNLGFQQNFGIRIKGASTRNHKDKSFNVYARSKYGESKLNYELIEGNKNYIDGKTINKYDSFAIRAFEWIERLRDKVISDGLADVPELAIYNYNRCMFFIDGEFWGMYDVMERCSGDFIQSNYGIDAEKVSIIKNDEVEEGPDSDLEDLHQLSDFCKSNDLSNDSNYQKVAEKIDIDSIAYHYAVGIYVENVDWPNKNYFMWRNNGEQDNGNTYCDGKWRFASFDFDWSVGLTWGGGENYSYDFFQKLGGYANDFPTTIFIALCKNKEFKEKFSSIFTKLAKEVFEPNKMKNIISENDSKYMKYMVMGSWRWRDDKPSENFDAFSPQQTQYFQNELNKMIEFFSKRPEFAIDHMKRYLGLS